MNFLLWLVFVAKRHAVVFALDCISGVVSIEQTQQLRGFQTFWSVQIRVLPGTRTGACFHPVLTPTPEWLRSAFAIAYASNLELGCYVKVKNNKPPIGPRRSDDRTNFPGGGYFSRGIVWGKCGENFSGVKLRGFLGDCWENFSRECLRGMSRGGIVCIPMEDESLRVAVTIRVTLVNTHTHTDSFWPALLSAQSESAELKAIYRFSVKATVDRQVARHHATKHITWLKHFRIGPNIRRTCTPAHDRRPCWVWCRVGVAPSSITAGNLFKTQTSVVACTQK